MIYSILIPAMVDRSISVYMLLYLDESQSGQMDFNNLKVKLESDAILEKRFLEHQGAGSIEIKDNTVYLTTKGKIVAKIFLYNKKACESCGYDAPKASICCSL